LHLEIQGLVLTVPWRFVPRWGQVTFPPKPSGWWYTYPSEKYESVGMMTFPSEWKKKITFQTTNQIIYIYIYIHNTYIYIHIVYTI